MATQHGITEAKIRALNAAAVELVADHFLPSQVKIFDAFLPLQARYNALCLKYNFSQGLTKAWECQDRMHTGFVINDHYAQMLLNEVCQSN